MKGRGRGRVGAGVAVRVEEFLVESLEMVVRTGCLLL